MRHLVISSASLAVAALATIRPALAGASADAGFNLSGRVVVPEGMPFPQTVVFLEPSSQTVQSPPPPVTVVSQKNATFIPNFVVVPVGATVEFRNDESTPLEHNVYSTSKPNDFDLGVYGPDVTPRSWTFNRPGEVAVFCSSHSDMSATIYVTPSPYFAVADAEGRFTISGVPPGEYTVKTWQRRRRFKEASEKVTISPGSPAEVTLSLRR